MNKAILIGNLGADPELRYTQSNQPVLSMRLATTERYADKSGEQKERTDWHSLTLWGKRGEALSKFLHKGSRIAVEGRIQYRSWEDKDGNKRTSTDINVSDVELLGDGGKRGGGRQEQSGGRNDFTDGGGFEDDTPF